MEAQNPCGSRAEVSEVLVVSHDVVGATMAGPGIRYYHLAETLAHDLPVTLAIPAQSPQVNPGHGFALARYTPKDWPSLEGLVDQAEVVVLPSDLANEFPQLAQSRACVVIDGYDPLMVEWLALSPYLDCEPKHVHWAERARALTPQYLIGDFFLCASERQRDWWIRATRS